MIEVRELIKKLGKDHTVILSSHILSEISAVCDHIFIISKGKLVASDTTENLTEKMESGLELTLEIKGAEEDVRRVAENISGVHSIQTEKENEEGICKLILESEKNTDIRESVFYAFANAELPIYGMNTSGKSLEDIFLALTGEGGQQ